MVRLVVISNNPRQIRCRQQVSDLPGLEEGLRYHRGHRDTEGLLMTHTHGILIKWELR